MYYFKDYYFCRVATVNLGSHGSPCLVICYYITRYVITYYNQVAYNIIWHMIQCNMILYDNISLSLSIYIYIYIYIRCPSAARVTSGSRRRGPPWTYYCYYYYY